MKQSRIRWLIKPDVQLYLVKRFLVINVISMIFVYLTSQAYFNYLIRAGTEAGLPENHVYFDFIKQQTSTYAFWLGWIFLGTSVATVIFGFYFSNRFAGPIYQIINNLRESNNGKAFKELKLRKGDLLQDLAEEINKFGGIDKK